MKKLMTMAVAGLALNAFCVESSNVVGYNQAQPEYSYFMVSVPFSAVNGDALTVDGINGAFEMEDQIQISYVDGDGIVQFTSYMWWPEDTMGELAGWYQDDVYVGDSLTIPAGSAAWFITNSGSPIDGGLTVAGAVRKNYVEHDGFAESYNMIASGFPVAFNPNAATVEWSGIEMEDQIQVAWMDGDGIVQFTTYMWWPEDTMGELAGWYQDDIFVSAPVAEVGQGFWLILANPGDAYMKETSPIAD